VDPSLVVIARSGATKQSSRIDKKTVRIEPDCRVTPAGFFAMTTDWWVGLSELNPVYTKEKGDPLTQVAFLKVDLSISSVL
jgi:hypothetical protein